MSGEKFSAILLQPHDTPLSQLLSQHRQILGKLAQSSSLLFPEHQVYPLQPSHCLVQSPLEIQQLKKHIRGCTILPPVFSQGLLLRPVQLEGGEPDPKVETVALQSVLPFFHEEMDLPRQIPGGMVFGCIKDRNKRKIIDKIGIEEINHINEIMNGFKINPLKLRVFRLRLVEYSWDFWSENQNQEKSQGENRDPEDVLPSPPASRTLTWTLDSPQWVKIK